jgi:hypothetical protein
MIRNALFLSGLLLFAISCSLPLEYTVRSEFYPGNSNYSSFSGTGYKGFRIFDLDGALVGYMLTIPIDDGTVYLKIDTHCMLETALLHTGKDKKARRHPVYQSDWGRNILQLAERDNLRPMLMHFLENQYRRDTEIGRRGSAFSLF